MAPDCHLGGGMAHFHRLILVLLVFCCGLAAAQGYEYQASAGGSSGEWSLDQETAVISWKSRYEADHPGSCVPGGGYSNKYLVDSFTLTPSFTYRLSYIGYVFATCATGSTSLDPTTYSGQIAQRLRACPANSSVANGACVCNPGYQMNAAGTDCLPEPPPACPPESTRINGVCVPDPDCPDGYVRINGVCQKPPKCRPGPAGDWTTSSSGAEISCFGGCVVSLAPSDIGVPLPEGGVLWTHEGTYTGAECSGTGTGGTGSGSGSGGNGDGSGSGGSGDGTGSGGEGTGNTGGGSGMPTPTPTPPGSAPPPPQPQPPNEDGSCPAGTFKSGSSCIKNPEPPNADGVCPAGTSKVNGTCVYSVPGPGGGTGGSTGGGTGTGTGTGEGSAFAGNCGAGFACTGGDAIQCAIAKEQYVRNCKLFDDKSSPEAQRYLTAVTAPPSNATDGLPGNETVNLGPSRFDQTDALGVGGGGMTDLTVVVMGSSISLPFSRINPYLAMFGNVLVAVSLILAARIVARG